MKEVTYGTVRGKNAHNPLRATNAPGSISWGRSGPWRAV